MNAAEILLNVQRLDDRIRTLTSEVERISSQLASNPAVERLAAAAEEARRLHRELELRLRDVEGGVEEHRQRLRSRDRELMSGRIRVPSELQAMSVEVEHMRQALASEEESELILMEEADEADTALKKADELLAEASERAREASPGQEAKVAENRQEVERLEAERSALWAEVPSAWQAAYKRVQSRLPQPVAGALNGQCGACRVGLTSNQVQTVRRGDQLVYCDNCGRILVQI